MNDWTAGYVADIGYTFGYYSELNPVPAKLALLQSGLVCPEFSTACELGFGQGLSANIHAAGSSTRWYGTDFNPSQAAYAQELAAISENGAELYDQSFAEFCSREDLPDFDYIGLHGIWSWISDSNREIIVDFIRRKLRVGGVLYISYNTLPGWAAFAPMRHLMTEHAEVIGSEGRGIVTRISEAVDFADKLMQTNPNFSKANPLVADRIKKLKTQNSHYLAHEYFNKDWHPMHFSTMADWLEPAKVQFACSAASLDRIDAINLSQEQQEFLNEIPDLMFRESVKDFMVNQQFRKDYWIKGARRLSPLEQAEKLREIKVVLLIPATKVVLKITGALGDATMSPEIYNPLLEALSDHKPKSIGQLESVLKAAGISHNQVVQAVTILIGGGNLAVVQNEKTNNKIKTQVEKLNNHLISKSKSHNDTNYLASTLTGSGISLNRMQQLFISAFREGYKQTDEMVTYAWNILNSQGQRLIQEGKTLETAEENIKELNRMATEFVSDTLPTLKALQII